MKTLILTGALLLTGGLAHASAIHCEGSYFFYHFAADANTSGNQIVGNINVTVSGGTDKQLSMAVTTSDVEEGQYIHAAAQSSDGSGQLTANYDSSAQSYSGTLNANTTMGNANVDVVCTMTDSLNPAFDMSIEEANLRGLYPVTPVQQ